MKPDAAIANSGMSSMMAEYISLLLPRDAEIAFLYRLDSETDRTEEVLIGYTPCHLKDGVLILVRAAITEGGNKQATVSCEE